MAASGVESGSFLVKENIGNDCRFEKSRGKKAAVS